MGAAAGIGIAAGALALLGVAATRSAAPETIGVSVAARLGGILLALPTSRPLPAAMRRSPAGRQASRTAGAIGVILGLVALLAIAGTGDAAVAGFVGLMLAVAAVMLAVQVVVLVFAMKGRNGARSTLAAIAVLGIVISLASGQGLNIGSAISILSVALRFMPDATAWYRARSGQP